MQVLSTSALQGDAGEALDRVASPWARRPVRCPVPTARCHGPACADPRHPTASACVGLMSPAARSHSTAPAVRCSVPSDRGKPPVRRSVQGPEELTGNRARGQRHTPGGASRRHSPEEMGWDGLAEDPNLKGRQRSVTAVGIPQGGAPPRQAGAPLMAADRPEHGQVRHGTIAESGKNVGQRAGLNQPVRPQRHGGGRSRCRSTTVLPTRRDPLQGPRPGASQRGSACEANMPGSRGTQATCVCKNLDCRRSGNTDWIAAQDTLHLYRMGHALIPAAGRAGVRRARRVKPATAKQGGTSPVCGATASRAGSHELL